VSSSRASVVGTTETSVDRTAISSAAASASKRSCSTTFVA